MPNSSGNPRRPEVAMKIGEVFFTEGTVLVEIGRKEYQFNPKLFDHILDQMTECIVSFGPDDEGC